MNCIARSKLAAQRRRTRLLVIVSMGVLFTGLLSATLSHAATAGPHWLITSTSWPTYFKQGDPADVYTLYVMNDGGGAADGNTVTVADALPMGVTATGISGSDQDVAPGLHCTLATVSCTDPGNERIAAGDLLVINIAVSVGTGLPSSVTNSVSVSGGGAPNASVNVATPIGSSPVPFGTSAWTSDIVDMAGNAETQAGSHPFEMTTALAFNVGGLEPGGFPLLNATAKDIEAALPPGLVGDPNVVPRCPQSTFQTVFLIYNCPTDTQVGTIRLFFY
jgi:hypothetical protein